MELKRKILSIDDEPSNRELVSSILADKFKIVCAEDGEEGVRLARSERPDLILLDMRLPKLDGLAVCESLRMHESTRDIPIIMVTGATETEARVEAFMYGADDFLSKPFRPRELRARVFSKMRRLEERSRADELLEMGEIAMNVTRMEVRVGGAPAKLTSIEFNLLRYLLKNRERVVTRENILDAVWRDTFVSERAIDTHVVGLRRKLGAAGRALRTVYGTGYILTKEP